MNQNTQTVALIIQLSIYMAIILNNYLKKKKSILIKRRSLLPFTLWP